MELSIKACDKLIVDSNFAKKEIIELLKIKKEKVFTVYLGVDKKFLRNENNDQYLKNFNYKNYIISVLSCVRYHNIIKLLEGFKLLKVEKNLDLKFVLVLQILDKNYYNEIIKFVEKNFQKDEIIFLHNLNSNYLINLYKNANLFIFSSYCEVFGLTSLEAMSQGCPVLISNRSALPEINSDVVDYFDPDNEEEIKNCLYKILNDNSHRDEIKKRASNYFEKFNWDKTVNDTLKILLD